MPASQKRIKANRRNAKKSTGPRTKEGKQRSSQNAKAPTLDSLLPPAERHSKEFMTLLIQFRIDLRPQGMTQEAAVERIATLYWKLRRLQYGEFDLTRAIVTENARANRLQAIVDDDSDYLDKLGEQDRKAHEARKNDDPVDAPPHEWYFAAMACGSKELIWSQKYELQLQRSFNQSLREYQRLRKFAREEGLERDADPQEQFIDDGEKLVEFKTITRLKTEYDDAAKSVTVEETIKNEAKEEDDAGSSVGAAGPSRPSSPAVDERLGTAVLTEGDGDSRRSEESSENEAKEGMSSQVKDQPRDSVRSLTLPRTSVSNSEQRTREPKQSRAEGAGDPPDAARSKHRAMNDEPIHREMQ